MARKILALTSIRSDYDLMSEVYRKLQQDPAVELKLLVSGPHLSPAFGHTVDLVRQDGFDILCEVETLISGDTQASRLKTAAGLLNGAMDLIRSYAPDLIVYAGDREDVLIAATIGTFLGIPTAHFFGGDHAADGHVDNPVRHATSKLSTAHFVSLEEHRRRLLKLGEIPQRIFVIGSVALDKFVAEAPLAKAELLAGIGAKPHAATHPLAILIFHPVAQEREVATSYVRNAVAVLRQAGFHVCIGTPNSDPGNASLMSAFAELGQLPEVTCYGTTSRLLFVNLMRHASLMLGNSSAGILEAATLRLPVINIGERQRGRLCGANVIFTGGDCDAIAGALATVRSPAFTTALASLVNPYGDGQSAARAAALLRDEDFLARLKKPEDPLHVAI